MTTNWMGFGKHRKRSGGKEGYFLHFSSYLFMTKEKAFPIFDFQISLQILSFFISTSFFFLSSHLHLSPFFVWFIRSCVATACFSKKMLDRKDWMKNQVVQGPIETIKKPHFLTGAFQSCNYVGVWVEGRCKSKRIRISNCPFPEPMQGLL